MAVEFTQESVLRFILSNGGKVRNADLLSHYRRFLREDEEREQNRELFKKYVNSVATVRQEDDASQVVLRKKYRALLGDVAKNLDPAPVRKHQDRVLQTAPKTRVEILPAAGIVTTTKNNNNNDFTPSFEKGVQTSTRGGEQPVISTKGTCPLRPAPPDIDSRSSGSGRSVEQTRETKATRGASGVEHDVYPAKPRQLREADGCESFVKPTCYYEVRASPLPGKPNTLDACKQFPKCAEGPPLVTIGQSLVSTSTPCLLDAPPYVHTPLYTQAGLSRSNDSLLRPHGPSDAPKPQNGPPAIYLQPCHAKDLTSSQDSLSTTSLVSDTGWNQGSGRDEWSSDDASQCLSGQDEKDVRSFLRRNQETRLLSQLQQPSRDVGPLHHSTGHLDDQSSSRSASPEMHHGPVARRLSSRLRSRMCRSLGENLDLQFPEEIGSARHNRLQLLSSTLSMGNLVNAPSSKGSRDFSSPGGSMRSLGTSGHDGSFSGKHSSVPLEPREHEWFVKAASGAWTDIYALFREDPNLLYKRDFISGFTILHWIAKHGDHRVLNTLSYGVEKASMTLEMDAKTLCGYTPLHLAAIHGHKKLIRLLVQKFKADVGIRDSSGKRPWQYLSKDENRDILEILRAPQKMIDASPSLLSSVEKLPMRPATSKINVKRHSSIAALFKHKSHLRVTSASEAF